MGSKAKDPDVAKAWSEMTTAERIELSLRCMATALPHDWVPEARRAADKGNVIYSQHRNSGFDRASVIARVAVINEVLQDIVTHGETLERVKKGPQPGQSRSQLLMDLSHATCALQNTGSFGGGMLWSSIVALYEKALGYAVTPQVRVGDRVFDMSTVELTDTGVSVLLAKGKRRILRKRSTKR
jgi:hypothetical protein